MDEQQTQIIRDTLAGVIEPSSGRNIVDLGMVSAVQAPQADEAVVILEVDPKQGSALEGVRQEAERQVLSLPFVRKASVILTAQKQAEKAAPDPHGMNKNPPVDVPARHIIVVASGKGGVGKSTVAANLAAYLANNGQGLKVGLLDADIYGPSQPMMMGDEAYKPQLTKDRQLIPLEKHNLKIMSIGFIADQSKALVWRGPMVQTAFYQMLRDVAWASKNDPLDYLIIDLPPGTGDVQLTLAQKVKVSGAVIVSTPQDVALIDARRAVEMFNTTNVPVLGLVENMSLFVCPNCGHEEHIFGHGGAEAEAKMLGIKMLGAVPLSKTVRLKADEGAPIVLSDADSAAAKAFAQIGQALISARG